MFHNRVALQYWQVTLKSLKKYEDSYSNWADLQRVLGIFYIDLHIFSRNSFAFVCQQHASTQTSRLSQKEWFYVHRWSYGIVIIGVCVQSVCLCTGYLKKLWMSVYEIFGSGRPWDKDQLIRFQGWFRSWIQDHFFKMWDRAFFNIFSGWYGFWIILFFQNCEMGNLWKLIDWLIIVLDIVLYSVGTQYHWRIQDFRLGGRSSAEVTSIEEWGLGRVVHLPNQGVVWGQLLPRKFFGFFAWEWCILRAFWHMIRQFTVLNSRMGLKVQGQGEGLENWSSRTRTFLEDNNTGL